MDLCATHGPHGSAGYFPGLPHVQNDSMYVPPLPQESDPYTLRFCEAMQGGEKSNLSTKQKQMHFPKTTSWPGILPAAHEKT